jgi:hypothetical protein
MKIFISMGMKNKTTQEVVEARDRAFNEIKEKFLPEAELIDSVPELDVTDSKNAPMVYLSRSIELMAEADIVFFVDDFFNYRGCEIEKQIARQYGKITHDFNTENFESNYMSGLNGFLGASTSNINVEKSIA